MGNLLLFFIYKFGKLIWILSCINVSSDKSVVRTILAKFEQTVLNYFVTKFSDYNIY